MKRILGYFRLMSPADPDSPLGGGGSEDLPVTKIPTAEEVVAHRRERIAQKEKDYEDSRKNRFSKQPQDDSGKGDEEDEDEDTEVNDVSDQPSDTSPARSNTTPDDPEDDEDTFDDIDLFDDDDDDVSEDTDTADGEEEQEEEEQEEGEEDEAKRVKTIRAKLKQEGQARKKAETDLITAQTKIDEMEKALAEEKDKSKNLSNQNINWSQHDSVAPLWDDFDRAIVKGASSISDDNMAKQFASDAQNKLLSEYYNITKNAKSIDDRISKNSEFRRKIEDAYGITDGTSVVNSISSALGIYNQIEDKVSELKSMHENNTLEVGVGEYRNTMDKFKNHIDSLGDVDEDYIETAPDAIESVVGSRYKSDPSYKLLADKRKKEVTQLIFGLPPLTQDQLSRAKDNATTKGMTIEQYLKRREDNFTAKRTKFINDVFYHSMFMEDYDEVYSNHKKVVKARGKRKAVSKTLKKKNVTPASKKTKNPSKVEKTYPGHKDWVPVTKRFNK